MKTDAVKRSNLRPIVTFIVIVLGLWIAYVLGVVFLAGYGALLDATQKDAVHGREKLQWKPDASTQGWEHVESGKKISDAQYKEMLQKIVAGPLKPGRVYQRAEKTFIPAMLLFSLIEFFAMLVLLGKWRLQTRGSVRSLDIANYEDTEKKK